MAFDLFVSYFAKCSCSSFSVGCSRWLEEMIDISIVCMNSLHSAIHMQTNTQTSIPYRIFPPLLLSFCIAILNRSFRMFETGRGCKSFRLALLADDPVLLRTLSFGPDGRTEFPNFTGDPPAKSRKEDSRSLELLPRVTAGPVLLGTFSFNPDPRFPNSVVLVFTGDPPALACMPPKCPPYCNVSIPLDLLWNPV